jgi:hypothetical protein
MATFKQIVEILDDAFNLAGTARLYADTLRTAGILPKSQGKPEPLAPEYVAMLLLAVMLGEPVSNDTAARVQAYAALRPGDAGPTLGTVLAGFVNTPHDLFALRLEIGFPAATLTLRGADRGMATLVFTSDAPRHSGVERYAVIDGNTMTRLSAAISSAPPVKAGRRRRNRIHT